MPANTPRKNFPYPLPTEPVAQGADAIKNLAVALDGAAFGIFLIAEQTLTANGNPVAFQNIPQTFRHLIIMGQAYEAVGGVVSALMPMRCNADATAKYANWTQTTTDTVAASVSGGDGQTTLVVGVAPGTLATGFSLSPFFIFLPQYARTDQYKTAISYSGTYMGGNGIYLTRGSGTWKDNSAINRLDFWAPTNAYGARTTFSLYGMGVI